MRDMIRLTDATSNTLVNIENGTYVHFTRADVLMKFYEGNGIEFSENDELLKQREI